jgi:hypothetical protein
LIQGHMLISVLHQTRLVHGPMVARPSTPTYIYLRAHQRNDDAINAQLIYTNPIYGMRICTMLRPHALRLAAAAAHFPRPRAGLSTKASGPLRILFCGSDDFSCESLSALHREHVRNPRLVESLDVMVRPPKRTGRGLKQFREVPCKTLADSLSLTVHERDTFRGWPVSCWAWPLVSTSRADMRSYRKKLISSLPSRLAYLFRRES